MPWHIEEIDKKRREYASKCELAFQHRREALGSVESLTQCENCLKFYVTPEMKAETVKN